MSKETVSGLRLASSPTQLLFNIETIDQNLSVRRYYRICGRCRPITLVDPIPENESNDFKFKYQFLFFFIKVLLLHFLDLLGHIL